MTANSIKRIPREGILHICDNRLAVTNNNFTTLLWNDRSDKNSPNQVSIVEIVEANSDDLRKRYLSWIYDLGEYKINGKSVIEHLSLQEGFSYWWSTSLGQKFNCHENSQINDAIKALAFEDFFLQNKFTAICLISSNNSLAKSISSFCRKKNISYIFHQPASITKKNHLKFSYTFLPRLLRAFISFFRYILKTLPLYFINESKNLNLLGNVIFIDILVHLKSNSFETGRFQSNYWTSLVDKLNKSDFKTNWLHLFFKHSFIKSLSVAQKLTKKFSFSSGEVENHKLLERPLHIDEIFFVISNFLKTRQLFHKLKKIQDVRPVSNDIDLWPFHEHEWRESLCGSVAVDTYLKLSLFSGFFSSIPKQRFGVYICENQPWEFALIYAWRKYGHGKLIGVPHTTLRYWDLRYFYDPRSYSPRISADFLMPDVLAVNGPVAKNTLLSSGYPSNRIVETEALRFMYLSKSRKVRKSDLTSKPLKILVCGDFLAKTNNLILTWLVIANKALKKEIQYIFKPHPAYPLKKYDHSIRNLSISEAPLVELLNNCDLAFTSNITSAAVDAYCLNIPLIQILNPEGFNTSPLIGLKNIKFVSNPSQFIDAINSLDFLNLKSPSKYFFIDKNLTRWLALLEIKQSKRNKI